MKTIIHIGQHKTATTSIQSYLAQDRKHLSVQGLYVPIDLAGFKSPSHFILNVYALKKDRMSSMKEKFLMHSEELLKTLFNHLQEDIKRHYERAKNQGCNTVIWSNEGLYLLNSVNEYTKLINLFSEYSTSVECICCFRELLSYRHSYMKQLEKQGINFSENYDSYRYVKPDSWLFDYERKKKLLNDTFERVITFDYNPEDNLKEFLRMLGYDETRASSQGRLNVTN